MKKIIVLSLFIFASCGNKKEIKQVAEISCGQCQFELDSESGCSLAVRVNDKAYFVDGFGIDDFGDAHNINTGFCNVIRTGKVSGTIEGDRFLASSIDVAD
ncbi:hypothetical protein KO506_07650 [Polaribacter vadi]|uniref:DUF6370 family protein n=1 Tax=Polaribacter TaxID=52959 RepID=UPI001C091958|nr:MULTISPECIES: DUF6370 family protein [Polaribacter]MBU3011272.1 hypothetical protein [Polaribacter vadi]MDO6741085.1 DUF6370 family protein [Polaribacter sp. 1_MG-2023]